MSFNSLPEGETYHLPPEEDEEDDPFDTSSVVIQNNFRSTNRGTGSSSEPPYDYNRPGYHDVSGSGDDSEHKPSIISQLLASNCSTPPPALSVTPPTLHIASSTPEPRANNNVLPGPTERPHRRAVSTTSEVDGFFPPLASPFSPPAFNPYDIILGSNEAIAGLDSPVPGGSVPKRQTHQSSVEAFSWLNDKIGDMKVSEQNSPNVFQFPSVNPPSRNQDATLEEMYATVKKRPKDQQNNFESQSLMKNQGSEVITNTQQTSADTNSVANNNFGVIPKKEVNLAALSQSEFNPTKNQPRDHSPIILEDQPVRQQEKIQVQQQMLFEQQQRQQQEQRIAQQVQQQQEQQMLQQQILQQQQLQLQQQQSYAAALQREKEMERRNLEKIQQHKHERELKRQEEERKRAEEERRIREASLQRQREAAARNEERIARKQVRNGIYLNIYFAV